LSCRIKDGCQILLRHDDGGSLILLSQCRHHRITEGGGNF
jgi:hypothetical protein